MRPANSAPKLAIVARFYGSGDSSAHVYVCDLDGKHLKKLGQAKHPKAVRWLDRNSLAVDVGFSASSKFERGIMDLSLDGKRYLPLSCTMPYDMHYYPGSCLFRPLVEPGSDRVDVYAGDFNESLGSRSKGAAAWMKEQSGIADVRLQDEYSGASLNDAYLDKAHKRLWLVYWTHNSTTGSSIYVGYYDSKAKKTVFVNPAASEIDITPERTKFAMITPRSLAPLGRKHVWVSQLLIGDWVKRETREVRFRHPVWIQSMALQP